MKRTNQFERTDRDITRALLELLDEKPFEKITVTDIIEQAMINRSTFYQHFPDKYAILERLQEQYVEELADILTPLAKSKHVSTLEQMDFIMHAYFAQNRKVLSKLMSVRTETVNIQKMMESLLTEYLIQSMDMDYPVEQSMFSGLLVNFFTYYLEHPEVEENFSTLLFEAYFDMTLHFFRLKGNKEAEDAFMKLLSSHANK